MLRANTIGRLESESSLDEPSVLTANSVGTLDVELTEYLTTLGSRRAPREPDILDTAAIVGLEIAGPVVGGLVTFGNPLGIAAGGALGNLASQKELASLFVYIP